MMLVLRVLARQPLHGYAIAQRIHQLSADALRVEEGSLYPALQKLLVKGWVKAAWRESESGRQVREYRGGRRARSVCCWMRREGLHGNHW
jgi:DNA-binding PadR family transcriptional regulator